ncbi:MAG: hypothetical protein R2745_23120 [Vicinamibacterales bacterium]
MSSPQLSGIREGDSSGQPFIVGTGGRIPEGQAVEITLSNVPAHSSWPFWVAVASTAVGLIWVASSLLAPPPDRSAERRALQAERERLLGAIAALDAETRARGVDEKRQAKRQRLLAAAEQVYAQIDELPGESGSGA